MVASAHEAFAAAVGSAREVEIRPRVHRELVTLSRSVDLVSNVFRVFVPPGGLRMAIRVLHIVDRANDAALQSEVRALLPHLQCNEIYAGALSDGMAFARLIAAIRNFRPDIVHT